MLCKQDKFLKNLELVGMKLRKPYAVKERILCKNTKLQILPPFLNKEKTSFNVTLSEIVIYTPRTEREFFLLGKHSLKWL